MDTCTRPHVLVTGASSGIGRATALRLATSGYHVFAGVRKRADGTALTEAATGELTPLFLDVTDARQITAAVKTIASHVGDAGLACRGGDRRARAPGLPSPVLLLVRQERAPDGNDRPAAAGTDPGRAAPQARQATRPRIPLQSPLTSRSCAGSRPPGPAA